jgi:hypothetical protein
MRNSKRGLENSVTIDGVPLLWRLHRELYLEYPAVRKQQNGYAAPALTIRPPIVSAKVAGHIREAMAAGWDPESRGKPFVYEVAELPS